MAFSAIKTTRLLLRPFVESDGPALHGVVGDEPDMTWDSTSRTVEQVTKTVLSRMKHVAEHGFGVWAVIDLSTGEMVGQTGLQLLEKSDEVELVTYTAKRHWRKGYASEGCLASLRYGFESLGLASILAVVREDNPRAQSLISSLGFKFEQKAVHYETDVQVSRLASKDFRYPPDMDWLIVDESNG